MKTRTDSETCKIKTMCGPLFIIINRKGETIVSVRIEFGKNGTCAKAISSTIGNIINDTIANKEALEKILLNMKEVSCNRSFVDEGDSFLSCIDAIGETLSQELLKKEEAQK